MADPPPTSLQNNSTHVLLFALQKQILVGNGLRPDYVKFPMLLVEKCIQGNTLLTPSKTFKRPKYLLYSIKILSSSKTPNFLYRENSSRETALNT